MKASSSFKQSKLSQIAGHITSRVSRKWMLWLAAVLFIVGTGSALYQPVHPDPWHVHTGWDKFIYPQEQNAFLRQPSVSQGINDVFSIGQLLWAVGDGGLILHSNNGGQCWIAQGPWVQSEGMTSCPQVKTGLQRIFSGLSATLDHENLLDRFTFPAYAMDAPSEPQLILDPKLQQKLKQPVLKYNTTLPQQTDIKSRLPKDVVKKADTPLPQCGGLNQRPCSVAERIPSCDAGLVEDFVGNLCVAAADTQTARIPDLKAVAFFDQKSGIVVGDSGTILLTQDGGNSWQPARSGTVLTLNSIVILDDQTAIIGGNNGLVLRSVNQGNRWSAVASNSRNSIVSITRAADNQIFAVATNRQSNNSTILYSRNNGVTWSADRRVSNLTIQDLLALDKDHLIIGTNNGNILESTDNGNNWRRIHHENGISITSFALLHDRVLIAVGSNGSVIRSTDNAKNWHTVSTSSSAILTSVTLTDSNRLLAVGSSGSILLSEDEGASWRSLTRGTRGELSAISGINSRHLTAVGNDGVILYSNDGGDNWMPGQQVSGSQLRSITPSHNLGYLAVGDNGVILSLNASGELLQSLTSDVNTNLFSIINSKQGGYIAIGNRGTIISSDDGSNWNKLAGGVPASISLQAIASPEENQLVIVGQQGLVLRSQDAGNTWQDTKFISKQWLLSIAAINRKSLIATGYNGTILRSDDAGVSWRILAGNEKYSLNSITAVSENTFLAVGSSGTILRTVNGGETWDMIPAGTTNNLNSITLLANSQLFIAGSGGVLLRSIDGGLSWKAIENYTVSIALWWYLLLLCIFAVVMFVVWPRIEVAEDEGIAGLAASDRPLQPGDPDALNLTGIASDITSFLSNPKTTAPLTMAITGPWGSGKSSLMNLVRADLKARGFSPVWFNAWHHQKGEQLLASLFSHIKQQAIPSWFSFDGLWFRLKLGYIRGRRHWFIFAIMLALLFLTLSFNKQELSTLFLKLSLLSDPKLWWQLPWQEWTPDAQLLFSDGDWVQTLASLFGIGTPLVALLRSIRGFGISPRRLISIDQGRDIKSGYDPGARARFANEFRDVTQALGNNKMVIFIDDLDRCSQANLIDILENINFIASSGDCFMLLGMAPKYIEACVANHYETLARSIAEKEKHESHNHSDDLETHKFRFAHNYLEKMINIEITIPQMQPKSIDQLLNPQQQQSQETWWKVFSNTSVSTLSQALNIIIPVIFILLAIGSGWEYGRKIPPRPKPQPTPVYDLWVADKDTLISLANQQNTALISSRLAQQSIQQQDTLSDTNTDSAYSIALQASKEQLQKGIKLGSIGEGNNQAYLLLRLNEQTQKPVISSVTTTQASSETSTQLEKNTGIAAEFRQQSFESGDRISTLWLMFSLLMFVSFAFYLYRKKSEKYAEDSDDFKQALLTWTPWIQLKQETPRAVKRFLNHLRFLAIRNHQQMHESLLVAMATIYFYNSEWLLDESKFKTLCDGNLYPLLESDYQLQQQDKDQQENLKNLLINLADRLGGVLKEININDLCAHRERAIKILGGALPLDQENEKKKQAAQI